MIEGRLFDVLLLGGHGQVGVAVGSPVRNIDRVDERVVVDELQPDQVGRFRSRQRDAEKALTELFSGGRISVRMDFGIRRKFRNGMDQPEADVLVERDDALGVAHRGAGVAVGMFVVVQDVQLVITR